MASGGGENIVTWTIRTIGSPEILDRYRKAADNARGSFDKFEKASKKLVSNQTISQVETLSSIFIQFGGNISRVASVFTSLLRPVTLINEVFGPQALIIGGVGLAAIGATSAVIGMTRGLADLAASAGDAGARLKKSGQLAKEYEGFVRDMGIANDAASAASDRLTVALAATFGGAEQLRYASIGLKDALVDMVEWFGKVPTNLRELNPMLDKLATVMIRIASLGFVIDFNAPMEQLAARGKEAADEYERLANEMERAALAANKLPQRKPTSVGVSMLGDAFDIGVKDTTRANEPWWVKSGEIEDPREAAKAAAKREQEAAKRERELEKIRRARERDNEEIRKAVELMDKLVAKEQLHDFSMAWSSNITAPIAETTKAMREMAIMGEATIRELEKQTEQFQEQQRKRQATASNVTSVIGGFSGGALAGGASLLSMAGPWGAIAGAILQLSTTFADVIENIHRDLTEMPGAMLHQGQKLIDMLPKMISDGPKIAGAFAEAIPRLIGSLIAAAPAIFAALIEELVTGPFIIAKNIVDGIKAAFASFPKDVAQAIADVFGALPNKVGDTLGIHLGKRAKGEREFLGIRIPSFDRFSTHGGRVTEPGLAYVHKGEVFPSAGQKQAGGVVTINIGSVAANNPERFVEQLQTLLGSRGIGLSLTPHGG